MSHVITGDTLRAARELRGLTQAQVAEMLERPVDQKTIRNWEAGAGVPAPREAEIRALLFPDPNERPLRHVSNADLLHELSARWMEIGAFLEEASTPPEGRWHGAAPARRTRRKTDTPVPKA